MERETSYESVEECIRQIKDYLDGKLSPEDLEIFRQWEEQDPLNRKLLERIQNEHLLATKICFCKNNDKEAGWKNIQQQIHRHRRALRITRYAVAATIAIFIGTVAFLLYHVQVDVKRDTPVAQQNMPISEGSFKAYLELASGEYIALDSSSRINTRVNGAILKTEKEGILIVDKQEKDSVMKQIDYHRIVVPKTGEYHVVLADGSQVWLNSLSILEFPSRFTGKDRRVKLLSGEAYFEVTKDTENPFIVEVEDKEVRVLGTSFNINNYEKEFTTTLVTGKVEVSVGNENYLLTPAMQIRVENDSVSLSQVRTREFTAWKDGWFIFKNQRLEKVLTTLSRWYNIEIFYQKDKLKDLHFTGSIQRHSNISELLQFLQKTGSVKFVLNEQTLIVSE